MKRIPISDYAAFTPFGTGVGTLWRSIADAKSSISIFNRFDVSNFQFKKGSLFDFENNKKTVSESLIWSLVYPLKEKITSWDSDFLILATTKGEIDLLENFLKNNSNKKLPYELTIDCFFSKMLKFFGIPDGFLVSAACASSSLALSYGAERILSGKSKRIAVVGIDIVSKFVFSGFASLQALSFANNAKPFDRDRDGLLLGEACGAVLLTDNELNRSVKGYIAGWGNASDANHVTGPSRSGAGLSNAVSKALNIAGISSTEIGGISAHGTGTLYNDSMEMMAFRSIFQNEIPIFSVKGATGHTMGASGIIESIVSLKALQEGVIPPTAGFENPDDLSSGWVSSEKQEIKKRRLLKTNSGFGGINCALILEA